MNRKSALMALAASMGCVLVLSSCASSSPVGPAHGLDDNYGYTSQFIRRLVDHERDDWNPLGVWRRVSERPPSYLADGTPKTLPLTEKYGTWFVDAVDGWRFFVPKGGTPKYSEEMLSGEARKITNTRTRRQNLTRNVLVTVPGYLLLPVFGFATSNP